MAAAFHAPGPAFGAEQVFAELDRRPERLREVRTKAGRAISWKSVERAIAAWREVATIREVETFLFTYGISVGLAARLVRKYGEEVVAALTHDPYRLVELPRVGFKIADGIARSLGVELDDRQRLQAGLRFVLEEAESDGNTFLPLTRERHRRLPASALGLRRLRRPRRGDRGRHQLPSRRNRDTTRQGRDSGRGLASRAAASPRSRSAKSVAGAERVGGERVGANHN